MYDGVGVFAGSILPTRRTLCEWGGSDRKIASIVFCLLVAGDDDDHEEETYRRWRESEMVGRGRGYEKSYSTYK